MFYHTVAQHVLGWMTCGPVVDSLPRMCEPICSISLQRKSWGRGLPVCLERDAFLILLLKTRACMQLSEDHKMPWSHCKLNLIEQTLNQNSEKACVR